MTRKFAAGVEIPSRYWTLARIWAATGTLATVLPLAALYQMVFKPVQGLKKQKARSTLVERAPAE